METRRITGPDDLYEPGEDGIDWTVDPVFEFATEADALTVLQMLSVDLDTTREQERHLMRYIKAAARAAHQGTGEGRVSPQVIINHSSVARQTIYDAFEAGDKE